VSDDERPRPDRRIGVAPSEPDPELAALLRDEEPGEPEHPLEEIIEDNAKTGSQRADERFINKMLEPARMDHLTDEDFVIKFGDTKVRRCKAVYKNTGNRCGGSAMQGQAVCMKHGGKNPNSVRAAQIRLATLVDPAIGRLARILVNGTDRDALRAIENVLDRTGFPRKTEVSDVSEAKDMLAHYLIEARNKAAEITSSSKAPVVDDNDYDDDDDEYDDDESSVIEVQGTFDNDRDTRGDT
jgi:hypothetical protein